MKQLTILFLLKEDYVLLAMKKRGFGVGKWNGVGGKVESDETVDGGMERECYEEIAVKPLEYTKVAEIIFNEMIKDSTEQLQVHVFTCHLWEGEPSESEEMAPRWFNIKNIPYEDMWSDDKYWLPSILEGKKIKAEFELDKNDKVTNYSIKEAVNL